MTEIILANNGASIMQSSYPASYIEINSRIKRNFRFDTTDAVLISVEGELLNSKNCSCDRLATSKAFLFIKNQRNLQDQLLSKDLPIESAENIIKSIGISSELVNRAEVKELGVSIISSIGTI